MTPLALLVLATVAAHPIAWLAGLRHAFRDGDERIPADSLDLAGPGHHRRPGREPSLFNSRSPGGASNVLGYGVVSHGSIQD